MTIQEIYDLCKENNALDYSLMLYINTEHWAGFDDVKEVTLDHIRKEIKMEGAD